MIDKKQKYFQWAAVVLWMLIIFLFSSQNATESSALSGGIVNAFLQVMHSMIPSFDTYFTHAQVSFFIRKSAHFTIYAILGILTDSALNNDISSAQRIKMTLLVCLIYAVSDEWHQFFVSGRSAQFADVCIDTIGAEAGLFVKYLVIRCVSIFEEDKTNSKNYL